MVVIDIDIKEYSKAEIEQRQCRLDSALDAIRTTAYQLDQIGYTKTVETLDEIENKLFFGGILFDMMHRDQLNKERKDRLEYLENLQRSRNRN